MINAHPSLAQSLPCKSALNGSSVQHGCSGNSCLNWWGNDVAAGMSQSLESGRGRASLPSFSTHGPGTKLPLSGALYKCYLCGLSAQTTLTVPFYPWGAGDAWRRHWGFVTSVWQEEDVVVRGWMLKVDFPLLGCV